MPLEMQAKGAASESTRRSGVGQAKSEVRKEKTGFRSSEHRGGEFALIMTTGSRRLASDRILKACLSASHSLHPTQLTATHLHTFSPRPVDFLLAPFHTHGLSEYQRRRRSNTGSASHHAPLAYVHPGLLAGVV